MSVCKRDTGELIKMQHLFTSAYALQHDLVVSLMLQSILFSEMKDMKAYSVLNVQLHTILNMKMLATMNAPNVQIQCLIASDLLD